MLKIYMYDMCICPGGTCPYRYTCARFLAEPLGRQDSFGSPPWNGNCNYYINALGYAKKLLPISDISSKAYEIYRQGLSKDELNWLIAKEELSLESMEAKSIHFKRNIDKSITITYENPLEKEVETRAYFISQNYPLDLSRLHWILAERKLMYSTMQQWIYNSIQKTLE